MFSVLITYRSKGTMYSSLCSVYKGSSLVRLLVIAIYAHLPFLFTVSKIYTLENPWIFIKVCLPLFFPITEHLLKVKHVQKICVEGTMYNTKWSSFVKKAVSKSVYLGTVTLALLHCCSIYTGPSLVLEYVWKDISTSNLSLQGDLTKCGRLSCRYILGLISPSEQASS